VGQGKSAAVKAKRGALKAKGALSFSLFFRAQSKKMRKRESKRESAQRQKERERKQVQRDKGASNALGA